MSGISKLVFLDANSSPRVVTGAVKFRSSNELSLRRESGDEAEAAGAVYVSSLPYVMEISSVPGTSLVDQVLQGVQAALERAEACIKSINGAEASGSSGAMFINLGDKCMNWTPDTGLN